MTILITGAEGFIGLTVTEQFSRPAIMSSRSPG